MRTVRSQTAKFPIVIAVVAVGAEELCSHTAALRNAVQIRHVGQQARLRERAAANMSNRMAGSAGVGKLRDDVQEIARSNHPHGKIAKHGVRKLPGAGSMTAQAVFILIHGRIHSGYAIGSTDAGDAILRSAGQGRRRKGCHLIRSVAVVTVRAGRMAITV